MENKKITNNGIGFFGLLTIAFIVLKLCGVISWSWIWVLAPLWITWTIALLIALIVVIIKLAVDR
jgi:hypothetical protein